MPSLEQLRQNSTPFKDIVLFSPKTGLTSAGVDHLIALELEDQLEGELFGAMPDERIETPVFPRINNAINRWGFNGEHLVAYTAPKPPPRIQGFELRQDDVPLKKPVEESVIAAQEFVLEAVVFDSRLVGVSGA